MGRDRNAFHDQETELKKDQEVIMAAGKRKYQPFFIGGSYTIARKAKTDQNTMWSMMVYVGIMYSGHMGKQQKHVISSIKQRSPSK